MKVELNLALPWSSFLINSPNQVATSSRKVFLGMPWHHTTPLCSQLTPLCRYHIIRLAQSPSQQASLQWCDVQLKQNKILHTSNFGSTFVNALNHTRREHWPWNWYSKKKGCGEEALTWGYLRPAPAPREACRGTGWRGAGLLDSQKPVSKVPETAMGSSI